jgi:uncharacterized protein
VALMRGRHSQTRGLSGVIALAIVLTGAVGGLGPDAVLAQDNDLPTLTAPVTDLAGVIDPAVEAELETRIRALLAATGDTVVVATVRTFQPSGTIEEFATRLFERAGVGDREKDRGLLVVLAVEDRQVRIEVGYGLEELVTDGFSGETIRRYMLPAFRGGQYGEGILAGTTHVIQHIADARGATLANVPREAAEREDRPTFAIPIVPALFVLFLIIQMTRRGSGGHGLRRRGRRGWHGGIGGFGGGFGGWGGGGFGGGFGGGGGGGGFGGFGGGMSGGGGASGRW